MNDSSPMKKHRIVFEIVAEGAEPWNTLLNNVENVRKAFGAETTEITVVGHGKGLGPLLESASNNLKRVNQMLKVKATVNTRTLAHKHTHTSTHNTLYTSPHLI